MELTWEPDSYTESNGYAFKVCDPNKLGIGLRQTDWDKRIVADLNEFRISHMWHEFGNAIFRPTASFSRRAYHEWKTSKPTSNRK